jgi:ribosomal-protein-alanine N-acetyltransferase
VSDEAIAVIPAQARNQGASRENLPGSRLRGSDDRIGDGGALVSALLNDLPRYRRMHERDLDVVMAIENSIYPHPWTRGNFKDSLREGYHCWVMEVAGELMGYSVLTVAAGEAHLLNLSIAANWQRQGRGREMLQFLLKLARDFAAHKVFLEVRPTNLAGIALYAATGFSEIAIRRGYYPAKHGREDAIVMQLEFA